MEHHNEYLPLPEFVQMDIDRINRALGQFGLYDASQDVYPVTEHDDETWALPLEGIN